MTTLYTHTHTHTLSASLTAPRITTLSPHTHMHTHSASLTAPQMPWHHQHSLQVRTRSGLLSRGSLLLTGCPPAWSQEVQLKRPSETCPAWPRLFAPSECAWSQLWGSVYRAFTLSSHNCTLFTRLPPSVRYSQKAGTVSDASQ